MSTTNDTIVISDDKPTVERITAEDAKTTTSVDAVGLGSDKETKEAIVQEVAYHPGT